VGRRIIVALVAVLALSACGGGSEPPAADTATGDDLPSGLTVRDYPEAMTWVAELRTTCAASRASISVNECVSDGAIRVCGEWFGGVDPENSKYTDCVADMQSFAREMFAPAGSDPDECWMEEEGKLHTC
jgi:hypothetical protein